MHGSQVFFLSRRLQHHREIIDCPTSIEVPARIGEVKIRRPYTQGDPKLALARDGDQVEVRQKVGV